MTAMGDQSLNPPVWTQCEGGVWTITLNRPRVLNAMTVEMFELLEEAIKQGAREQEAEVVLLRGSGGNFCSGADLSVLSSLRDETQAEQALNTINRFLEALHRMPKPVVALIEGAAVGAGLNLALHADFVVAAEDALLQEPFVQIGLTTDFGGTYLLPRLVGMVQAKRLALLGDKLTGKEAEQIGLIYKAVEASRIEEEVEQLISRLRKIPPKAYAITKNGLQNSLEHDLSHALQWEKEQQPALIVQPEFASLVSARLNKAQG